MHALCTLEKSTLLVIRPYVVATLSMLQSQELVNVAWGSCSRGWRPSTTIDLDDV